MEEPQVIFAHGIENNNEEEEPTIIRTGYNMFSSTVPDDIDRENCIDENLILRETIQRTESLLGNIHQSFEKHIKASSVNDLHLSHLTARLRTIEMNMNEMLNAIRTYTTEVVQLRNDMAKIADLNMEQISSIIDDRYTVLTRNMETMLSAHYESVGKNMAVSTKAEKTKIVEKTNVSASSLITISEFTAFMNDSKKTHMEYALNLIQTAKERSTV